MEWIKISTDLFSDEKIKLLGNDKKGDEMVAIWIRLLLMAGKMENDGVFLLKPGTPYSVAQIATIMGKTTATVKSALNMFESLGMIETVSGCVTIPNWIKYQGTNESREKFREANRERQRRFKENQRRAIGNGVTNAGITGTDKDLDKERELDKEKYKRKTVTGKKPNESYQHHEYTEADFGEEFYFNLQAAGDGDNREEKES